MVGLLLATAVLVLVASAYVCLRRSRHGGLAGGDSRGVALPAASSCTTFTAEEVARHDTPDDLWLIINGQVYNFTDYLPLHPGGEAILRNAGKDSTVGFSGSQHPQRVWDMIAEFHIGKLYDPSKVPIRELAEMADKKTD